MERDGGKDNRQIEKWARDQSRRGEGEGVEKIGGRKETTFEFEYRYLTALRLFS